MKGVLKFRAVAVRAIPLQIGYLQPAGARARRTGRSDSRFTRDSPLAYRRPSSSLRAFG